jgi:DNA-binding transcriptional MerR regulator
MTLRTEAARVELPEHTWTVGELADELGVTTRTLRHYEAEGLLLPARSGGGRVYTHRDRARLRLILRGKRFGMSLPEIREVRRGGQLRAPPAADPAQPAR